LRLWGLVWWCCQRGPTWTVDFFDYVDFVDCFFDCTDGFMISLIHCHCILATDNCKLAAVYQSNDSGGEFTYR
jgi:hypothetical protein